MIFVIFCKQPSAIPLMKFNQKSRKMKKSLGISALTFAVAITLSACGNNNTTNGNATQASETTAAAAEPEAASNSLTLEANDEMQFSKTELRAVAGQTITLTLKHTGKMDKTVMGHDFVLLKQGTDIAAFGREAMTAKAEGFVPKSELKNVIAFTKLLGGGESDTIQFSVSEKGTYDYICSFPGHYAMMKGQLIVE